jgi:hypothetical protein
MVNNDEKDKKWHDQQLIILKGWAEISASYRWLHYRTHIRYKIKNYCYMIPIIIMSTITGTANFAQGEVPAVFIDYAPLVIGTVNILSAILTTIYQFAKISELMESHRISSINYGKLSRNIDMQINLPEEYRSTTGSDFMKDVKAELDRLIDQSQTIPKDLLHRYKIIAIKKGITQPEISKVNRKTIYGFNDDFVENTPIKKRWYKRIYSYFFNRNDTIRDDDVHNQNNTIIKKEEYEIIKKKISEKILVENSTNTQFLLDDISIQL